MKNIDLLLLLSSGFLLTGCLGADSSQTGDTTTKRYDIEMVVTNSGDGKVDVTLPLNVSAATDTTSRQTAEGNTATSTRKAAVGWNGGTGALAEEEAVMEGFASLFQQWQDNRKEHSDNSATTAKESTDAVQLEEGVTGAADVSELTYETRFHHTTQGSFDGGKSLVLCPGQKMGFEECLAGDIILPRHDDDGREGYWNMTAVPAGDIVCTKDGKSYRYKSGEKMLEGKCD
jgi:hypothetical protein